MLEAVATEPLTDWLVSITLAPLDLALWHECKPKFDGRIAAGSAEILSPGMTPRALVRSQYRYCRLSTPEKLLERSRETAELSDLAALRPCDYRPAGDLVPLVVQVCDALDRPHIASHLEIDALATALLARTAGWVSGTRSERAGRADARTLDWRVRRAIEYLEARVADDVGLDELAAAVDVSPSHLLRVFRQATGVPPHRWLMQRRVEHARAMLADPRLSVTEVAHACGFASSQHFATAFRRHTGATPSDYRRERLS